MAVKKSNSTFNKDTVGNRIKITRKSLGLSQEQLAKELSISRSHISNIENGNDNPSDLILQLLSIKFNVYLTWLTTGEGFMRPDYVVKSESDYLTRYDEGKGILEGLVKERTNEDLENTLQIFSCMVKLLRASSLDAKKKSDYLANLALLLKTVCCKIEIAQNELNEDYNGQSDRYASILKECSADMPSADNIVLALLNAYLL